MPRINQCCHARAGDANAQHYFVATQEKALRGALGKVSGGASIFLNANGVHLEPPSERQRRGIEQVRRGSCLCRPCAALGRRAIYCCSNSCPSSVLLRDSHSSTNVVLLCHAMV